MLGFAMRAGRVSIGTELVLSSLAKHGNAKPGLVLTAADASDGTKKKIRTKCEFYSVKNIITEFTSDELGERLGKSFAPMCIGITDDNFAAEISAALSED